MQMVALQSKEKEKVKQKGKKILDFDPTINAPGQGWGLFGFLRGNVGDQELILGLAVQASITRQLAMNTGNVMTLKIGDHTQLGVRLLDSTAWCGYGECVPCLSLPNIHVGSEYRRQGHARRTLKALNTVASDSGRVLLVENVVSDHMHKIIGELKGQPLPGSHVGRKGAHYWIPS